MEELGIIWNLQEQQWLEGFRHAREYSEILAGEKWMTNYVSPDGFKTGQWLRSQQRKSKRSGLEPKKAKLLADAGFSFSESEPLAMG